MNSSPSKPERRVLAIVTVDVMAWVLIRPWLEGLQSAGYEVHVACARTNWFEKLAADGFHMHDVPLRRRMNPRVHIAPLWALYRLIRRERFAVVNTHSPVAAAVGRLAAWLARAPVIIYVVHGFYFHDDMPCWKRRCSSPWSGCSAGSRTVSCSCPTKTVKRPFAKESPRTLRRRRPSTTAWISIPTRPRTRPRRTPENCGEALAFPRSRRL